MKLRLLCAGLVLATAAVAAYLITDRDVPSSVSGSRPAPPATATPPPVASGASAAPGHTAPSATDPATRPAWLQNSDKATPTIARPSADRGAEDPAVVAEQARMTRLTAVMTKLQKLQSNPQTRPRELVAVLDELQSANGSPVVGGVRIDVLRNNVRVAEKMQGMAEELRRLQHGADSGSPQNQALIQARLAEMEALRGQLSADVLQGSPAP